MKAVSFLAFLVLALASHANAAPAPKGELEVKVVDADTGEVIPCRMYLQNVKKRPVKMGGESIYYKDHAVFSGQTTLKLNAGQYLFEIERGPEYPVMSGHFEMDHDSVDSKTIELKRFVNMAKEGWYAGDLHVHRPVDHIELLMKAEDLYVCPVITWWNDKSEWATKVPPSDPVVRFDNNRFYNLLAGEDEREGGAILFFNLKKPLPIQGAAREYPSPLTFIEAAKRDPNAWIDVEKAFWYDLPTWLASGLVDSIGICHNHMWRDGVYPDEAWGRPRDKKLYRAPRGNGQYTQDIYYHVLNTGLRIPPSAGSASGVMANPVGYDRMYVFVGDEFTYDKWWDGFRQGRVVVTNGPILRPMAAGRFPGHVFQSPDGGKLSFTIDLSLSTRDKIEYLEIVKNGQVEQSIRLEQYAETGKLPPIVFEESGWFLLRVVCEHPKTYRFASTAPWYVEIGDQKQRISRASAEYFRDWVQERIGKIKLTDEKQRAEVMKYHEAALKFWEEKIAAANAP
jgi:hypothetical protein